MNEEEVIASICDAIQERLGDANESRNFLTQTILPQGSVKSRIEETLTKTQGITCSWPITLHASQLSEENGVVNDLTTRLIHSFKALRIRSSANRQSCPDTGLVFYPQIIIILCPQCLTSQTSQGWS